MASQPNQDFAALLRRQRLLAGLSQEALAERAQVSVRAISDLERGQRRAPHPATLARLADALDLDPQARESLLLAAALSSARASPTDAPIASTPEVPGGGDLAQPLPSEPPTDSQSGAPSPLPREERRWVTVLAVQLGGFAVLAERLDPEDLHALVDAWAERTAAQVRSLDGTVLRGSGHSILAVFGAPAAHEDDAERALRAGLAIVNAGFQSPAATEDVPIKVRVGLETGEVLAGFQIRDSERQYTVSGACVTVALGLADRGEAPVLVGENTYRATYQHVRYRNSPAVHARDFARPLAAWEPIDVAPAPRPRALGNAPFVGRQDALDLLLGSFGRVVREQRPHMVSVLGEPGIGKSRLVAEFERRVVGLANVRLLHGRCQPYGEVLGYRALAMALYELAGITPADAADRARAKLSHLVRNALHASSDDPAAREIESHLALLSGLAAEAPQRIDGPADERTMHVSVRRFLEAVSRAQPICLVIEDLHWGDETLLSLLEHVAERATAAPLLIITQARLDLLDRRPTWGGGIRAFTSLSLEPLDRESGLALANALCRERGLTQATAAEISRISGGNPLFAEELCAAMAERQDPVGVPSALRTLISARLDALPAEEKRALQYAAVIGKHVWQAALAALDVGGDLTEQLEALERRDLLRSHPDSRFGGWREFSFKHDLIQETAYGLLPRAERRRLHGRIVEWLEQAAGERIEEILDLLAHHAVSADLDERALNYLSRAAERARRAAAHREEAALLDQAAAIAQRVGRADLLAELRARRGRALTGINMWMEARQELERALGGLPAEQRERRAEVLVDLALACNWSLDTPALRRRASEARELASAVGRKDLAFDARFWMAWATGSEGDVASAIDQYQEALDQSTQLGVALSPSVLPLCSTALCWAGRFENAIERGHEAVRIARQAGATDSTILALQVLGLALAATGAYDDAERVFDEARRFGREYGVGGFLARSTAMSAGYHLDVFDFDGHAAIAEEACDLARSTSFLPALTSASIDLLLNFARRGEPSRAESLEHDVAAMVERGRAWHGWLWNLRLAQARAELALARGATLDAIRLADTALQQARGRRPKYEVLGLLTRASALASVGRTNDALVDLNRAMGIGRTVADPALVLRTALALLALDGNDALANQANATARHIFTRLPTDEMRDRFIASEPVRRLQNPVDGWPKIGKSLHVQG